MRESRPPPPTQGRRATTAARPRPIRAHRRHGTRAPQGHVGAVPDSPAGPPGAPSWNPADRSGSPNPPPPPGGPERLRRLAPGRYAHTDDPAPGHHGAMPSPYTTTGPQLGHSPRRPPT